MGVLSMRRELRKTPGPWSGDGLGEASWDFPQEERARERVAQRWRERRKEGNADFMAGQTERDRKEYGSTWESGGNPHAEKRGMRGELLNGCTESLSGLR
jgi:hypothetical protein